MKKLLLNVLILMMSLSALADDGYFKVKITDKNNGQPVAFAMIECVTAHTGGYTDINGDLLFNVPEGKHQFKVNYLGMEDEKNDVLISAGDTTYINWEIGSEAELTPAITINVQYTPKSDAGMMMKQRKAPSMLDGVSSQSFKKAGAKNASQIAAMAPGVSVQDGKHVVVRGLGDRYSKTTLNSMSIPGLDPDKNSVQLDVFPSNLLDNVVIYKTFSPDLPADFAGGLVNLSTKAVPERRIRELSMSVGFNPNMHLRNDYLSYVGGSIDFLGFDDGTRALPISKDLDLTSAKFNPASNNAKLTEVTRKFNSTLAPQQMLNGPDFGFSYSVGNKFIRDIGKFGLYFTANYNNSTTFYEDAQYGTYIMSFDKDVYNLLPNTVIEGAIGEQDVRWSALFGASLSTDHSIFKFNVLHSQNGESKAALLRQEDLRENPSIIYKNNLEYTQRSVTNVLLQGQHKRAENKWILDWSVSPTLSIIDEPDIRLTAFEYTDDLEPRYEINEGVGAVATRTYRNLIEQSYNAKFDVTRVIELGKDRTAKVKFGILETFKNRDFEILNYQFRIMQESRFTFSGDADELLAPHMIWTATEDGTNDSGVYVNGNREPANQYNAKQNILGVYVMHQYPITKRLTATYGVRMEKSANYYTGSNQSGSVIYNNAKLLDELNFLPSANLLFNILPKKMNLRGSYNQTLARPSFKELSNAQIVDRISGRTFIGNDTLKQTSIQNFDLRWEYFLKGGQMFSFTSFYKTFQNPIELVAYSASAPDNFQPRNVGEAVVYGVEMEVRKRLTSLRDTINRLQVGTNLTIVHSEVEMTPAEYQGRLIAARDGHEVATSRDMVGQSPYIINGFINYTSIAHGLDINLNYNVQGESLAVVGVSRSPDVYELPFHNLGLKMNKSLSNNMKISFGVNNILNSSRVLVYRSYEANDEIFSQLNPGRRFSLGFNYTL